jgi:uncharacterized protein
MAGKFQLSQSKDGKTYFNLVAGNGEKILTSEMYSSKQGALDGIASVKKNSPDDKAYERKTSAKGKDFFVLKAANHQVIGSSEEYSSKSAMEDGIKSVMKNAPTAEIKE